MRRVVSLMGPLHPDYPALCSLRDAIGLQAQGLDRLIDSLPLLIRDVIDQIIDPVRTGRTRFELLDNVEKTFIGLKVEHVLRDLLDVPKGLRDLIIDGLDVDVKNTVRDTWTIPPETYRREEPCILIASEEQTNLCWIGLFFAREKYLTASQNRDGKKAVSASGQQNILWLLEAAPYPRSRWLNLDMERFRELRKVKGGNIRLAQFLRENLDLPIHRSVIQALLFDQKDYMKRVRGNGGARDDLAREGIAVFSGHYDRTAIDARKLPATGPDEIIATMIGDDHAA
jgi:hypothetical protein